MSNFSIFFAIECVVGQLNILSVTNESMTNDDKMLIKILCLEKGYSAVQMMREFPARN